MKRLIFLFVLAMLFFFTACSEDKVASTVQAEATQPVEETQTTPDEFPNWVSQEEYYSANDFQKRLMNRIDAAIRTIDMLEMRGEPTSIEALVTISRNPNVSKYNSIIILFEENRGEDSEEKKCTGCSTREKLKCLMQIDKDNEAEEEFDVHISKDGDCYTFTWK